MPRTKKKIKKRAHVSRKANPDILSTFYSRRIVIVVSVLLLILAASVNITTTQAISASTQNVLGEDDQQEHQEEEKKEEEKHEVEQKQEKREDSSRNQLEEKKNEEKKSQEERKRAEEKKLILFKNTQRMQGLPNEGNKNLIKVKTENTSPSGIKQNVQSEGLKSETEIESADGRKIKTKIEDDGTKKVEIESGTVKLKYVVKNGMTVLEAKNESGQDIELSEDDLDEIKENAEQELEDEGVELSKDPKKPAFVKNSIRATTKFPLSIDVVTKQLIITTPQGQKTLTVLPDEAVKNMLATGIINSIDSSRVADAEVASDSGQIDGVVGVEIKDGKAVYEINGFKKQKVFGLFPVSTPRKIIVSAETGKPLTQEESLFSSFINTISR